MIFANKTFIGIDPTRGARAISYAAIDADLRLLSFGRGSIDDVIAFVVGQQNAHVGIAAPQSLSLGTLKHQHSQNPISPFPRDIDSIRLAEYELWKRKIKIYHTPPSLNDCKPWVKLGFKMYERLSEVGFMPYTLSNPPEQTNNQYAEVYPEASYNNWLNPTLLPKRTISGRLQRQLILYDLGLDVPDPMEYFEEITRHHLLMGQLPVAIPYSSVELDLLASCYTVWLATNHPQRTDLLGNQEEGIIVIPNKVK